MSNVECRKVFQIAWNLTGPLTSLTCPINCPFIPDEMILRAVSYNDAASTPAIITSTLVSGTEGVGTANAVSTNIDGILCMVTDLAASNPHIRFPMRKPVQGNYTFNQRNLAGAPGTATGFVWLCLEFVKYRPPQMDKGPRTEEKNSIIGLDGAAFHPKVQKKKDFPLHT